MKKAFIISHALFVCCLLLSLSQVVTAQISTTNYTAPTSTQPRTEQAPMTRSRKAAEWENVRAVRLNELTATEQQANQNASGKKAFRIGVARQLPRQIESLSDFTSQSTAQGTLYLLRVISPGAKSLRLHFKSLQLPTGAHLFVSSRQNAQVFSPAYTDKRAEFWTPSLPGEEVIIECFVPSKAAIEKAVAPFQIDAVNHIFRAPRESNSAQIESAGACNQEVPAEFNEAAKATALIAFSKSDGEYVCSGTLMADIKKTGTPYFLTANHCISNGGEAASAEVYWNYNSGPEPTTTPTRGAQLLATDEADDFTFLQLSAKPPGGVVYSGWTAAPQAIGTSVTGIHHPQADYKRASFGKIVEASCIPEIPAEFCDFFAKVRWDRGITEGGSSGSGIFIGTGNQTQLVGILSGGESDCNNQAGADYYGRMSRIFGAFGYYLTNEGICRYTLLNDRFMFGQTGGNGEFTVVPKIGGENCPWQARSNVPWITFTNATGNALGKVTFQVAPSTGSTQRIGAITIAGRNVLVQQNPEVDTTTTCAPTKIDFGKLVTGDLKTSTCRSLIDPTKTALRFSFDRSEELSVTMEFRDFFYRGQIHIINPDKSVTSVQRYYPLILSGVGTHIIEFSLDPSLFSIHSPFSFLLYKGCGYKLNNRYFEVDGFGFPLNDDSPVTRINAEPFGVGCSDGGLISAIADEPMIDDNKISAINDPLAKAISLFVTPSEDTKPRYFVVRLHGNQPIILRQTPRCNSSTTFSYSPTQVSTSSAGGVFQMEVKRTAGPICSWAIVPTEIVDGPVRLPNNIIMQRQNYGNATRITGDGTITYQVLRNEFFQSRKFALQKDTEVVQTITQSILGSDCPKTILQVGQTINGALTTTDCAGFGSGEYVDVYELRAEKDEQIAIELSGAIGTAIEADWGTLEVTYRDWIGSLREKDRVRWPQTEFYSVAGSGTKLIRVIGQPGAYQLKVLGVGPAGCIYKINKEGNISLPADATSVSVQLECNRGDCDWTAQSTENWVTFANGASGKGSQTLNLTVAQNTGVRRYAVITIAGRAFNLIQDTSCLYRKYSTAAPNKLYASYEGGEYNYYVETGPNCPTPTITPSANWISASAPSSSVIKVNITANTGGFRKGSLKIAGEDFEVFQGGNDLVVTTAADYQRTVAPGSLVTLFNEGMTAFAEAAQSLPLPSTLANASVLLELPDKTNVYAPLLFAAPSQINFYLPESVPTGKIKIKLASGAVPYGSQGSGYYGTGEFDVANVAPNVFTAAATGRGPAAAEIQRIRPGQPVVYEPTFGTGIDEQGKPIVIARPITIGTGDEKTFLVLYATGVRKRNANAAVTAQIGDVTLPVEYAGAQGQFVGLDQINIQLPPSLRGKGLVNVTVTIDGKTTNPVQINIAP